MQKELFHRRIAVEERKRKEMSKNKPLSNEEKDQRLLEVFHEGQEFYQQKELEKLVKGMPQKQVSETLKRLVAKGAVSTGKIGPSNFYWSFPESVVIIKAQQKDELKEKMNALSDKLDTLEAALKSEQVNFQLHFHLKLIQSPHTRRKHKMMEKMD